MQGSPMEELEKGLKELKGFAAPCGEHSVNRPDPRSSWGLDHQPVLVQKFGIPKIQFTGQKPKKKEDPSVDASVLLRRVNKILTGGNRETKCGAETEGKAIQRLPHLEIHPINSHQTWILLWMLGNAC